MSCLKLQCRTDAREMQYTVVSPFVPCHPLPSRRYRCGSSREETDAKSEQDHQRAERALHAATARGHGLERVGRRDGSLGRGGGSSAGRRDRGVAGGRSRDRGAGRRGGARARGLGRGVARDARRGRDGARGEVVRDVGLGAEHVRARHVRLLRQDVAHQALVAALHEEIRQSDRLRPGAVLASGCADFRLGLRVVLAVETFTVVAPGGRYQYVVFLKEIWEMSPGLKDSPDVVLKVVAVAEALLLVRGTQRRRGHGSLRVGLDPAFQHNLTQRLAWRVREVAVLLGGWGAAAGLEW